MPSTRSCPLILIVRGCDSQGSATIVLGVYVTAGRQRRLKGSANGAVKLEINHILEF
jgi:hypothetical protein